jgi:membrane protein required for beta-lactamase induction
MDTTSGGNVGGATREGRGRVVSSFGTYREAERAVDRLSDEKFPVERVRIVGQDLRFVEEVTGRFTLVDAVLRGALSGGLVGLLIGWLFAVFNWFDPVVARGWLILDGLWFGLLLGALLGLLMHALTGGRRDFSSVPSMKADRYELVVDEEVADEATRILGISQSSEARADSPAESHAEASH